MEGQIIRQSVAEMPDGEILMFTTTHVGHSMETYLFFGISYITWWGSCDPEKDGYKKLLGNLYYKA